MVASYALKSSKTSVSSFAPGRGLSSTEHVKGNIACHRGTNGHACNGNPGTEPYLVAHNLLIAHAAAVDLHKQTFQQHQEGKIGITLFSKWFEPLHDNELDEEAATRAFDFMLGCIMIYIVAVNYHHGYAAIWRKQQITYQMMNLQKWLFYQDAVQENDGLTISFIEKFAFMNLELLDIVDDGLTIQSKL
ncbi:Beta-glucosidase 43 [Abeliophyllum distichum]|uniref:Beta-glucosidase 43 n=1 Tax=Abeliophyllum distichum TaxID=126358 RepID=A0ABD1PME8_9LAMI